MTAKRTSKKMLLNIPAIESEIKKLLNWEDEESTDYDAVVEELLKQMKPLKLDEKLLLSINKKLVVVFKGKNQYDATVPMFYSEGATNIEWLATDKRFKELEKLVGETKPMKKSGVILWIDNDEEIALEDFIKVNTAPDVTPVTAKDIKLLKNLKASESVHMGIVEVSRLK